MKLSEAILRGCEMTPKQAFGEYGEPGVATCVMMAAKQGAGIGWSYPCKRAFKDFTPEIGDEMIRLNDIEKWSRERIASWLAEKGL